MMHRFPCLREALASVVVLLVLLRSEAQPTGEANATLTNVQVMTLKGLGAIQGVSLIDGKLYVYGDVHDAKPRVGVIRELSLNLKPTGRELRLISRGKAVITHPTGLTRDRKWGTFIGETVNNKGVIYQIDWERAWKDGNLDRALLTRIVDDAAKHGCRPLFVTVRGKRYLATADYGGEAPQIRLYHPGKLVQAKRSGAEGVVVHRFVCGPNNQNLAWDEKSGQITCVQNVVPGKGWRLDVVDLAKAIQSGKVSAPGARIRTWTFPSRSELEGYRSLGEGRGIFVTASGKENLTVGTIKANR